MQKYKIWVLWQFDLNNINIILINVDILEPGWNIPGVHLYTFSASWLRSKCSISSSQPDLWDILGIILINHWLDKFMKGIDYILYHDLSSDNKIINKNDLSIAVSLSIVAIFFFFKLYCKKFNQQIYLLIIIIIPIMCLILIQFSL